MKEYPKLPGPIALVLPSLQIGGAERLVTDLARTFYRMKIPCYVVTLMGSGPMVERLPKGIHIDLGLFPKSAGFGKMKRMASLPLFLPAVISLAKWLHKERISVLHSHLWPADLVALPAARLAKIPRVVVTQHDSIRLPSLFRNAKRYFLRWAHAVVSVSQETARFTERDFKVTPGKLRVIPNGIDLEELLPLGGVEWRQPPRIVCIGRFHPLKGQRVLLQALSILKSRTGNCPKIHLIGEGPELKNLEQFASELELNESVFFAPTNPNIPELLSSTDILVIPSLSEGLPLIVLEGIAAGKGIIASRVGGVQEILRDDEAIFFPPGNAEALAAAISQAIYNPQDLKVKTERACRRLFRESGKFDIQHVAKEYLSVYAGQGK